MSQVIRSDIGTLYRALLGRNAEPAEIGAMAGVLGDSVDFVAIHRVLSSPEYQRRLSANALAIHLYLIHSARVKLVSHLLPKASLIVDLGGANGNLHDMGYPYSFKELIVVDLPPEDRCEMYRHLKMESKRTGHGPISTLYTNMTELTSIESDSIDMVWMGQAIEHITEQEAQLVYLEVQRVLRPEGWFCLDTPNRLVTGIHTNELIHPEHKIEYTPTHLQQNLRSAGFEIDDIWGVCEMPQTVETKRFHYTDFILGAPLSRHVSDCYIQYYRCRKQ